ncbi:hypothetical protein GW17_00044535 [Ensete ventricosum]|nr:hypothetical protein GW17_00044535 [Ensete ventricosum]
MRPVGLLPLRFVSLHSLLHVLFHVHNPCASNAGSRTATRRHVVDYGRTYVVRPKGRHQATIVWLHGLGDNGARTNAMEQMANVNALLTVGGNNSLAPVKSMQNSLAIQMLMSFSTNSLFIRGFHGL